MISSSLFIFALTAGKGRTGIYIDSLSFTNLSLIVLLLFVYGKDMVKIGNRFGKEIRESVLVLLLFILF